MSRAVMQQALEALERYSGVDQRACDAEEALQAALAEPEQEPVAWIDINDSGQILNEPRLWSEGNRDEVPLYTAPTPRKPLRDDEIVQMYAENPRSDAEMIEFARAIEKAHGIKEQET